MGLMAQFLAWPFYLLGEDIRQPLERRPGGPQSLQEQEGYEKNPSSLPRIELLSPGRPAGSLAIVIVLNEPSKAQTICGPRVIKHFEVL
jgi:hypothetical protein